jgi:quercetin dioxygenase-like cupin family protein
MGRIVVREAADLPQTRPADGITAARAATFTDGELRLLRRSFFPVGDETLELFEVELEPGAEVQPHAHSTSEIIFVTYGELHLGAQLAGAGAAILVEANTLYGFRAGPDGATFLNFRGDLGDRYMSRDEFLQQLRARDAD